MKLKIALASASLLVLSACGTSQDALQALQSMQIMEDAKPGATTQLQAQSSSFISYEKLSGSGNDVTLHGVSFKAPPGMMEAMADAESEVADLEDHHEHDGAAKPAPKPQAMPAPGSSEPTVVAKAETMVLKGLTMKDGKPLARDIVVSGVTPAFPMEGASLRIGTLGFEGMNEQTGKFIAGAFTKDGPGAPPAFADWAFKKASVGGITFFAEIPQDEGDTGKVNAQLGELSFNGLSNETLGLVRFAGLKGDLDIPGMPAVKGTFDLGTFDIEKFRLGMYAKLFEAGMKSAQEGGEAPDFSKLLADYTSPLETTFDAARWSGALVDVSGVKFVASPYSTTMTRDANGVVTAVNTPRWTMTLSADSAGGTLGGMGLMMLAMTGYPSNSIEFYSEGAATFDPVKDVTHWNNYNLGVSDLVDIKVSGGLVGLKQAMPSLVQGFVGVIEAAEATANSADEEDDANDADDGEDDDSDDDAPKPPKAAKPPSAAAMDNPDMMQSAMQLGFALMSLQVTDLDVELTDKKLVELILTQAANSSGKSAETMRTDIVAQLQGAGELMSGAGIDPTIANELTTALSGFMSGPGTLHVQLKPKNPIGAMTFMMSPTKESLGFSATFTPAAK